jgi:hypothetical protein
VFIESHRRPSTSASPNSLPYNLLSDPHRLNLYATIFYKKGGGRWPSTCQSSSSIFYPHKSFCIISFADPHPLTFLESYRFKKGDGRGYSIPFPADDAWTTPHYCFKSFICNTYELPASVANKRLTPRLNHLDATLTKNRGGTVYPLRSKIELGDRSHLWSKKKREPTSPPPLKRTAAISYLWPECVIRARMSRRLSGTVLAKNSARSAGLHLLIVALMACAHLSMPSALG